MIPTFDFYLRFEAVFFFLKLQPQLNKYSPSLRSSRTFCRRLSGLADERPGEGVCGQRLRDLQHATGAAEIMDPAGGEGRRHREEEKEKRDENRRDKSPGLLIPPSSSRSCGR